MSFQDFKGAAYAFREFNRMAQADIDSGTLKPARRIWKTANPAKVCIGWFERRVIRGEFKKAK